MPIERGKKRNKDRVRKDVRLIILFKSRGIYVLILALVMVYLFQDKRILNEPFYLFLIRSILALGIIVLVFLPRFRKYRTQSILSIPLNFVILKYSEKSNLEYYDCRITNADISRDKIDFRFSNRTYSRGYELGGHTKSLKTK